MKVYLKKIALFIALLIALSATRAVSAQTQTGIKLTAQAGLDGACKVDAWLPVRVTVENTGADLEARVQASYKNDQGGASIYGVDVSLPASSRKEFFLYVYSTGATRNFSVSVLEGGTERANNKLNVSCADSDATLFGVVADDPSAYNILNDIRPLVGVTRLAHLTIADLPDSEQGWAALDALVVANVDTGKLSAAQKQALNLWIANGGKLFITGGLRWQTTTAGLKDFMPVNVTATKNVMGLSALAAYIKDASALDAGTIIAAGTLQKGASVLVEQDGVPLLVEMQRGYGKIYYFAADPALKPLSDWNGMKEIYDRLLAFKSPKPIWANASFDSNQANTALSSMPQLALPSIIYVCCWLGIYILVVGPVNYFVLRRMKRAELAWVTVPVLVIMFSCLAFISGYAYRGTTPILNRLALAQAWEGVDQARVNALVGVYSPSRTSYNVETQNQFMLYPLQDNQSLQGNNWLSLKNQNGTSLQDVRVEIGGVQSIGAEGYIPALGVRHNLVVSFGDVEILLEGTITNTSKYTLRDAILVTPNEWLPLGDLAPNATKQIAQLRLNAPNPQPIDVSGIMSTLGLRAYPAPTDSVEERRRAAFLQAALPSNNNSLALSGVYLMGWLDEIPAPIGLQDQSIKPIDTTLYFEKLAPSVSMQAKKIVLTSSLYHWESSLAGNALSSYSIPQGGYVVRYQPSIPVHLSAVDSLEFTLQTSAAPNKIEVSLWNFESKTWDIISLSFNLTSVPNAPKYVGTNGEIRFKISGSSNDYIDVQGINFTLRAQP